MTPQKTISPRAWSELLLLSLIWGGSFLSIRVAIDEIGPLTLVAHRTFWAALVLWGVVALMRLPIPRSPRIWAALLLQGVLNNVIPFSLISWGQLHVETGLSSILNGSTAVFGIVMAAVILADERLTRRKAAGVAVGFVGLAVAVGPEALRGFDLRSLGQLAIVLASVSYGAAAVWGRVQLAGLPPQVTSAGMLTGSTLVMVPAAWFVDGPISYDLESSTLWAIGYISMIATAGAYLLYFRVLASAGSGNLLLCTLLIPPIAVALGTLVRGEQLATTAYLGFGFLVAGMLILDGRIEAKLRRRRAA